MTSHAKKSEDLLDYNLSHGATFLGHPGFSAAHSPADIDETLNRVESALGSLKGC